MKRLIIAGVSPRQFRYLAAALVLSIVFTLVTSSSLKNSRQYRRWLVIHRNVLLCRLVVDAFSSDFC